MNKSFCTFLVFSLLIPLTIGLGCNKSTKNNAASATGGGTATSDPGETLSIAVIPKGTTHEFWKSVHFGAEKAAKELGNVKIEWRGPTKEDNTAAQIEVVKNMISISVDGIVLAPNQKSGLVDAVTESIDDGIPVVIFDSGLDQGPAIVSYVATDNFKGGEMAAEAMAEALDGKGNVILLRYLAGSESTEQRENGFLEGLKKYPDIKVVSSDERGGETATKSKEKVDQLLQIHGDELNGIFAVCEPNANGTLEALRNAGLDTKVKFIAFDPSPALIEGMKDGSVSGIVLQDPVEMGYRSVLTIVDAINGKKVEDFTSTGEYLATPENMGEEKYETLLSPPQFDE